jgi:cardiolipin synthase
VPAFAAGFERMWRSQGCPGAVPAAPPPARPIAGPRIVKLIESDPVPILARAAAAGSPEAGTAEGGGGGEPAGREGDDAAPGNRIYAALLAAIDASRRSVHLTMAYFAPGADMVRALADAARRRVEVVLVLPGRSDFSLVLHAGRSYYDELLAAGVRIHEMDDAMMHAKTAVIDGVFATVGSSNMDWRSWVDNSEVNVIVLGDDFARELEAQFERDLAASRPVTLEAWRRRGVGPRFMEFVGRVAERLL